MRRLTALWALLAVLAFVVSTTTAVDASAYAYDAPAIERVDVHEFEAVEASSAQLSDARQGTAFGSAEVRGTSTTYSRSFIATNTAPTFRGDSRPPSQIFGEGFQPVGNDLDLLRHAEGYPNSGYVSTSKSPTVAHDFGPNVYEVRAPGGVDVNATLGPRSPFPSKLEVAYPGAVSQLCIAGCTLPGRSY